MEKSDVLCYKRGSNILKSTLRRRPKSKLCQIFVFEKGIVLAEKVDNTVLSEKGQSFVLKHLATFTVRFCKTELLNHSMPFKRINVFKYSFLILL